MEQLADISTTLDGADSSADSAGQTIAELSQRLTEEAHRAAGYGFEGIAQRLSGLTAESEELQERIRLSQRQITDGRSAASQVPLGSTPSDTITGLESVTERLRQAQTTANQTLDQAEQLHHAILSALDGGDPSELAGILTSAKEHIDTLIAALHRADTTVAIATSTARKLGTTGN